MVTFTPKHFGKSDGSHLPLLIKLMSMTDGPVMELGTGFFSTPVLHWLCNEKRRRLVSYESIPQYFEVAKNYVTDFHKVNLITDWDTLDLSEHWNIIFIDHAPGERRNVEMGRVAQVADYVVVHDTEPKSDWHYHYSNQFDKYKYRYDYMKAYPYTSIFSNFYDLSEFKK